MELEQESSTESPGFGLVDVDFGDYSGDNNNGGTNAETTPPPVLVPVDCLYSNISQVLLNLVSLPHPPLQSSEALCTLWCAIQEHRGVTCCPTRYIGDPEEQLLCSLWAQVPRLDLS